MITQKNQESPFSLAFLKQRSPCWIWFSYLIEGGAQAKVRKGVMSDKKHCYPPRPSSLDSCSCPSAHRLSSLSSRRMFHRKAIYWVTSSDCFKIIGEKKAIAYGICHEFDDETIPSPPRLKLVRHKVASTAREE